MIDNEGFRANVGIILCNRNRQLFWGHRIGQADSWQFPQGGIDANESAQDAMYRELYEEVGLKPEHVKLLGQTDRWLRYRLPHRLVRRQQKNGRICIGQKQIWFLLKLLNDDESNIQFDTSSSPEFDGWKWVNYWTPVNKVIYFKREVYDRALTELAPDLFGSSIPPKSIKQPLQKRRTRSLYRTNNHRRQREVHYTS